MLSQHIPHPKTKLVCSHLETIVFHCLHPVLTRFGKNGFKRIHNLLFHNLKNKTNTLCTLLLQGITH